MEVVIVPWEAGSAPLPSAPGSAVLLWPQKAAGIFFAGLCGAYHATLALAHPFGVRTDCCPGRSAPHRVGRKAWARRQTASSEPLRSGRVGAS